jgi:hypothetical protein
MNAFEAAKKNGKAEQLQQELEVLFKSQNKSTEENIFSIPATFLKVTVIRRANIKTGFNSGRQLFKKLADLPVQKLAHRCYNFFSYHVISESYPLYFMPGFIHRRNNNSQFF